METLKLKCTLLSDVVLRDTPTTEGKAQTLTFIPGNNFLGVVARSLYDKEDERTHLLFHSGSVRFGDAHPGIDDIRGVKVPAALFYPKLSGIEQESYVYHLIPDLSRLRQKSLKQCRSGYYAFDGNRGTRVSIRKNFAIKSAYDSEKRRSRDEQMYGLESLCEGLTLYFTVEIDDVAVRYRDEIMEALVGEHHIGRSRTAQYGRVEIAPCSYMEPLSSDHAVEVRGGRCVVVYADSRLIFLDADGYPTFRPTAADLGLGSGEILWDLSQVRTFRYAPWNYTLHAYDTDRCGIEKGSVLVVRTDARDLRTSYVGCYRSEGFGRVIYNPDFLSADSSEGRSRYTFTREREETEPGESRAAERSVLTESDRQLLTVLRRKSSHSRRMHRVYDLVNKFAREHARLFAGDQFASQWSSIRSLAMVHKDPDALIEAIEGYLNHGVAKEKWEKNGRRSILIDFLEKEATVPESESSFQDLVINLASTMGKKSSKDN